jgi:hypothetical protein
VTNYSLLNDLLNQWHAPAKVGDGATVLYWTDRRAATITKVTPKSVTVQLDKAKRIDTNGMSEAQVYEYERDPDGRVMTFRLNKYGRWKAPAYGAYLHIGSRREFYDYSF